MDDLVTYVSKAIADVPQGVQYIVIWIRKGLKHRTETYTWLYFVLWATPIGLLLHKVYAWARRGVRSPLYWKRK